MTASSWTPPEALWRHPWRTGFAAGGCILALLALVIWVPPVLIDTSSLGPAARLQAVNDLRGTLVTVLAGIAVALGTIVAAINLSTSFASNRDQLRLQRRGQVTERFTTAIQLLGHPGKEAFDLRIGGIYALEQIARDDPEELHVPIMEILTAFVRVRSREREQPEREFAGEAMDDNSPRANFPQDLQAALTVIGRRSEAQRLMERAALDLNRSNLAGARLNDASLHLANLYRASLRGADLGGADLSNAFLRRADLRDALLYQTDLRNADLVSANFTNAKLFRTLLTGARTVNPLVPGQDVIGLALSDDDT